MYQATRHQNYNQFSIIFEDQRQQKYHPKNVGQVISKAFRGTSNFSPLNWGAIRSLEDLEKTAGRRIVWYNFGMIEGEEIGKTCDCSHVLNEL